MKAIVIIICSIVGLIGLSVMFFLLYSIFWMLTERARELDGEPGDLEIPWGEDD